MATATDGGPSGEQLYTRGGPNVPDNRGQSMVAKHMEKVQKEKETRAMERLHLLLPALGPTVRAVALQECGWDEERALTMLRRFQVAKTEELHKLHKERRKHQLALQSGKPERRRKEKKEKDGKDKGQGQEKKRRREEAGGSGSGSSSSDDGSGSSGSESDSGSGSSDDGSSSSDGSSSGSESEGERGRRKSGGKRRRSRSHSGSGERAAKKKKRSSRDREKVKDRRRRGKKEKRSSKDKKEKGRKKEKKEKKAKRRKEKRSSEHKERAKQAAKGATGHEYGKYGIIRETDLYNKRPEFQLWAMEVKNIDLDAMPRSEEKELFKDYMEEFNTATLPHRKYYDLEVYEKQQAAKAARKGGPVKAQERTAFDDEAERKRELMLERQRQHQERLKQAYEELRTTDKAKDMREQQLLRSQMELAYKTGDREKAEKLAERLKPVELADIGKAVRLPASGT